MKIRLFILLMAFASSFSWAQNSKKADYKEQWKKINQLKTTDNLPKSALVEINKLYHEALKNKDYDQIVKAIMYKMDCQSLFQENTIVELIDSLQQDLVLPQPTKSIIYFLIADVYKNYFNANRWEIANRTRTNIDEKDIETWDVTKLYEEALKYYNLAIQDEEILKNTSTTEYEILLRRDGTYEGKIMYATLFDFLVKQMINALTSDLGVARPQQTFVINQPEFFADVQTFADYTIKTTDTHSIYYQVLRLYQKELKFRLDEVQKLVHGANNLEDNQYALIQWDIDRLQYIQHNGRFDNPDLLYENALIKLETAFDKSSMINYIKYWRAVLYLNQGNDWCTTKNEAYRYRFNEAYSLCREILKTKNHSKIELYTQSLQTEIESTSLQFTLSPVQYPNDPILAFVKYRNISTLNLNIYKVTENFILDDHRYNNIKLKDLIDNNKPFKTEIIPIPIEPDHQYHSTEIKINGLPDGYYVIAHVQKEGTNRVNHTVLTNKPDPFTILQVSPISVVLRRVVNNDDIRIHAAANNPKNDEDYMKRTESVSELLVVDSKTGEPLEKAKIDIYSQGGWRNGKGYRNRLDATYYTDNKGIAYTTTCDNFYDDYYFKKATITHNNHKFVLDNWPIGHWYTPDWYGYENENSKAVFFTDRAIYRPGQTIYYKALLFKYNRDSKNRLLPNQQLIVICRDVNNKVIAQNTLTTNEYGTIQGSFTIPQGLLNGHIRIETSYGSTTISVEEYKRPTFEVKFDPTTQNYTLNSDITVTGKATALSGYAIDGSKVQYRIVRNVQYKYHWGWFPPIKTHSREIASGEVTTDSQGTYSITFKAEADDIKNDHLIYYYSITADVTDVNGETRSAVLILPVSNKPLLIVTSVPETIIDRTIMQFPLTTTNLNGDFTPAEVEVIITELQTPARVLRSRLWEIPDTLSMSRDDFEQNFPNDAYGNEDDVSKYTDIRKVTTYTFATAEKQSMLDLSAIVKQRGSQQAWYRIYIKAKNTDGIEVEDMKYVQLIGNHEILDIGSAQQVLKDMGIQPAPIQHMKNWLTPIKTSGEPGENAEFWVGGSEEKNYVLYEVIYKREIVETKHLIVGKTPERIVIPIKEEHRGGFAVQFVMIQNGRTYRSLIEISVPYTHKMLDVTFTTFRDKLLPGEKEKWTFVVKNKKGEKEMAEMAATLYDASLDSFLPHSWAGLHYFYFNRNHSLFAWQMGYTTQSATSSYAEYSEKKASIYYLPYIVFQQYGYYSRAFYRSGNNPSFGMVGMMRSVDEIYEDAVVSENAYKKSENVAVLKGVSAHNTDEEVPEGAVTPVFQPTDGVGTGDFQSPLMEIATRQNFNETAFFYPQLLTNDKGEIIIEFTIPEALTRWKMLGFAHTKDFKIGNIINEMVTQKQVAISANAPRFFRENDIIDFTAKVNNITEGDLKGQAMLRLYDATTMQPVDARIIRSSQTQNFSIKAGESTGLKWTLAIPAGIQAITYKVTAQAGSHTDGEEKVIPVLLNSMLVTETMPFSARAGQERTFIFEKLKNNTSTTLRNHKLTIEFTSNPAWYAVQALPYLMEYPYECTEQTFSRFYANSLAGTIANSSPRVKKMFEQWRDFPENKEALLSNLEKNQELKQFMIEETPWVMQADNETERKKRIGLLFDLNRMSNELQRTFDKISKAQSPNGGFPWFAGTPESQFITQHILAGFEHLKKLNALDDHYTKQADNMILKGLGFMDRCIKKDYDNLIKDKVDLEKQHISYIHLHYLYTCSFSKHKPIDKAQLKAFEYYLGQADKYWNNYSLYNQAIIALVMDRYGKREAALRVMNSLKERSQHSEEMGMYWKDNIAGYFWHQAPIETQALLIEAFNEVTKEADAVEEMKIWLLRNKQTTDWKTTKATTEACYALLMTGSTLLDENQLLEVHIGGVPLSKAAKEEIRPEPGTGYVKTAWNGKDISNNMAAVKVKNPNKNGIAWGGMYWQYFEQLDKITSAETNLKMNKQLFLKKITENGLVLEPLNEKNILKVGDVVKVRMELRANRDFEYVHLKDMRAAGFEPMSTLSGYRHQDGLWYYESVKDASVNFFITTLQKGTYVFEYELRVTHTGNFSNGITTFQCMYAPEFSSHSEGVRVKVE